MKKKTEKFDRLSDEEKHLLCLNILMSDPETLASDDINMFCDLAFDVLIAPELFPHLASRLPENKSGNSYLEEALEKKVAEQGLLELTSKDLVDTFNCRENFEAVCRAVVSRDKAISLLRDELPAAAGEPGLGSINTEKILKELNLPPNTEIIVELLSDGYAMYIVSSVPVSMLVSFFKGDDLLKTVEVSDRFPGKAIPPEEIEGYTKIEFVRFDD